MHWAEEHADHAVLQLQIHVNLKVISECISMTVIIVQLDKYQINHTGNLNGEYNPYNQSIKLAHQCSKTRKKYVSIMSHTYIYSCLVYIYIYILPWQARRYKSTLISYKIYDSKALISRV